MFGLNVYPQSELLVLDISAPQLRSDFARASEKVSPPDSSRAVEEVADTELGEKTRVFCGGLVTHQNVGVNLQDNIQSSPVWSNILLLLLHLVSGAGGGELSAERTEESVRSHPPEVRPEQGPGGGGG